MNKLKAAIPAILIVMSACGNETAKQPDVVQGDPMAAEGKLLFQQNCSNCHLLNADAAGPALKGVLSRWDGDSTALRSYIRNAPASVAAGEPHAVKIWEKWKPSAMTPFPNLTDEQINSLIAYLQSE